MYSVSVSISSFLILKVLLASFNDSWIEQYPISQIERGSEELYKTKEFYRQKEEGTRKLF